MHIVHCLRSALSTEGFCMCERTITVQMATGAISQEARQKENKNTSLVARMSISSPTQAHLHHTSKALGFWVLHSASEQLIRQTLTTSSGNSPSAACEKSPLHL